MKIKLNFKKKSGIYCIKNVLNNKSYVGSSINIYIRLEKHRSLLRHNKHDNKYLQNSWSKNGEDSFVCFLLEETNSENLIEREQFWINKFGEYNLIKDVIRNIITKETKEKMSKTRKERIKLGLIPKQNTKRILKYDLQGNFLKEYNTIISAAKENKISKDQIARSLKQIHRTAGGFQWKYFTDNRIILPYLGRDYSESCKKLYREMLVIDSFTNEILYFESFQSCGKHFNVTSQTVSRASKNVRNLYKNRYCFIDLSKWEELLETPTTVSEDNQQPSLSSNTLEGSTTNSQIQTDSAEDSNANKSILPGINSTKFYIEFDKNMFPG